MMNSSSAQRKLSPTCLHNMRSYRSTERRLLWQSRPPESGAVPLLPQVENTAEDLPRMDALSAQCLRLCDDVGHVLRQAQQISVQHPRMQQILPRLNAVYGDLMHGIQGNYFSVLRGLQAYPGMQGMWPQGTFDAAGLYPYGGRSSVFPAPWMWYVLSGVSVALLARMSQGVEEAPLLTETVQSALANLTVRFPGLTADFDEQAMEVRVRFSGRSGRIGIAGQNPQSIASYLESRVLQFLREESGTPPPEGPSASLQGVPERIIRYSEFTATVQPPTAPVTIVAGDGADAQSFTIDAAGAVAPEGERPFTVSRTDGSLRITMTRAGRYAVRAGSQTMQCVVAEAPSGDSPPPAPEVPEGVRFEAAVNSATLPAGVTKAIAGRVVTLTYNGRNRPVDLTAKPIAEIKAFLEKTATDFKTEVDTEVATKEFADAVNSAALPPTMTKAIAGRVVTLT